MNANELADKLQMDKARALLYADTVVEAATMLRQQQAEIERLIGLKPITYGMLTFCKNCGEQNPYQSKTLTDEEILDALKDALNGWKYIRECHGDLYGVGWDRVQDKLEAILRKAQEK